MASLGRSRMAIDPRISTIAGRSTSGFIDQAGIALSAKRRDVLSESYEG